MAELGFRPNALARGLASKRSHVLALAFPMGAAGLNRTSAEFVLGATEAAQDRGYQLVLWPFSVQDADPLLDVARQGLADGVLLMEVALVDPRAEVLAGANIPHALIGRTAGSAAPVVDVDFDQTLADAVRHLVDLGHRRIGFVNHAEHRLSDGHGPTVRSSAAFAEQLTAHAVIGTEIFADESVEGGSRAITELLALRPSPTAVIVMNEEAAFGITAELSARRIAVPEEMSVLAVVSTPAVAGQTVPPLTTLRAPGSQLGRAGVEALLTLLDTGQAPAPLLFPCDVVLRASTGPAPGGEDP